MKCLLLGGKNINYSCSENNFTSHVILFIAIRNLNYTLRVFPIKRSILFRGCVERK